MTDRDRRVRRVILVEGAANALVLCMKLVVGVYTGSLAVLGDAVHSLTDLGNNAIAWAVLKASARPPDRGHPYGHRKFETLAVFVLGTLLTVLAVELALHAIRREQPVVQQSDWALALMLGVLVVNVTLAAWERGWARRLDSDILLADANHTLSDVLTTIAVIAGWQLSTMGYPWLDSLCALAVAGLVLHLALALFKRAVPVLVDSVAIEPESLRKAIAQVPGVRGIRRLRSRKVGNITHVDMIIVVESNLSTERSHAIADAVESVLERDFQAGDVSIHVEPDGPGGVELDAGHDSTPSPSE